MVNAVKVFKKSSPNGKVTAYLSRRDFVDHITHTAPVEGVIVVDNEYLRGRRVFGRVVVTYRYGRSEDEVMGLKFLKEFELVNTLVAPDVVAAGDVSDLQNKILKQIGGNAHPFSVTLPHHAPCSVCLDNGNDNASDPLGIMYDLRLYVSDKKEERPHKRNSVSFAVRRVQFAPLEGTSRQPQILVSRGFSLSPGRLNLEVSLSREIYCHGQPIEVHLSINNSSKKTVKNIKVLAVQQVEVTMTSCQFHRVVASLESREGCPITPGASLNKTFSFTPLASLNKKRFGVALDGNVKDEDANLASSTLMAVGKNTGDALGIVVSYIVQVKLSCGAIGGELSADLPFKLMHAGTLTSSVKKVQLRRSYSTDNIEFEEFARLRYSHSVTEE